MQENNSFGDTSAENQQPVNTTKKSNCLKLGFVVVLSLLILSAGSLAYLIKSNTELRSQLVRLTAPKEILNTLQQDSSQEMSIKIVPYRLEEEEGQMVAIFQINNPNKENNISNVTYWTDKNGACKATTQAFSEFIKVPAIEINDYVFFQFSNENGSISQIYADSPNPIFQCGALPE